VSKEGTLHLTYWREYTDSEERYEPDFKIYHTIFRNVSLSQLNRLNSKKLHANIKAFCDKNFNESASNFTGYSGVEMIVGSEYYHTYDDEFGESDYGGNEFWTDYGQKWNGRQFFKHDFMPKFTESLTKTSN